MGEHCAAGRDRTSGGHPQFGGVGPHLRSDRGPARLPTAGVDDLVAAVLAITPDVGPNETVWPGLTTWRFTWPQPSQWAEVDSLALSCVVQGGKRFAVDGHEHVCDPHHYLVFIRGMRFETELLEASVNAPNLSFILQIEPAIVGSLLVEMVAGDRASSTASSPQAVVPAAHVSVLDRDRRRAVVRFLRSLANAWDRRVLTPLYLREIIYRHMRTDQGRSPAARQPKGQGPGTQLIGYIRDHLSEPITVADMERHALMSPSALTSAFVGATGVGPYRYATRLRLKRASVLIVQGNLNVSEVAREVGYAGLSYFINEFTRQFATTPRAYPHRQRNIAAIRVDEATISPPAESPTLAAEPV